MGDPWRHARCVSRIEGLFGSFGEPIVQAIRLIVQSAAHDQHSVGEGSGAQVLAADQGGQGTVDLIQVEALALMVRCPTLSSS